MYNFMVNNISNHGLTFFQDHLAEPVKSLVSKRVAIVALMALSCLVAIILTYQCCSLMCREIEGSTGGDGSWVASTFSTYSQVFEEKIEDLEPADIVFDSLEEEQKLVKSLKKTWLDDPKAEVQRIKDAKILTDAAQRRIRQLSPFSDKMDEVSMVVGRVLELKKMYRKTHYVFTHGQAPEISIANQLIKEFVRKFTPRLHHPLKVPFRVPHTVTYSENADDFVTKYNAVDSNYGYADNAHNAEMISVDACLWNTGAAESALYFFEAANNVNMYGGIHPLLKIFQSIFSNYLPDETVSEMLAKRACKIADLRKKETKVGALYAICIPKTMVQDEKINFAYRCHPYGKKCECFPIADRIKVLEEMQANKFFTCQNSLMPQYRLLTSRLTEEKDVRSFAVDALPKDKRKFYRDQVKDLVQEATKYSHLYGLIEQIDEDPSVMEQINSLIETSPQMDPQYIAHLFAAKGLFYQ